MPSFSRFLGKIDTFILITISTPISKQNDVVYPGTIYITEDFIVSQFKAREDLSPARRL